MVDYSKIIEKIKKCKSQGEVAMVKDENNDEFFSAADRLKFVNPLVDAELDKKTKRVKEVAILLVKIRQVHSLKGSSLKSEGPVLLRLLEKEEKDNSIAYQILNGRNRDEVNKAIEHLTLGGEYGDSSTPQGKEAIEKRIKEVEGELEKLKREKAKKNRQRRIQVDTKINKENELETAQKILHRKQNLLVVLQAMMDSSVADAEKRELTLDEKGADGKFKKLKLSQVGDGSTDGGPTLEINDWKGDNLLTPKTANSNEPADDLGAGKKVSGTLIQLLRDDAIGSASSTAKGFLDNIKPTYTMPPNYFETSISNSHNQRRFNCKSNLESEDSFGHTFLKVLREIGNDRLKAVVKSTSLTDSEKTRLEKHIDDILKYISHHEDAFETENYYFGLFSKKRTHDVITRSEILGEWQKTFLTKKLDRYPYKYNPNWGALFELMHKVIPATKVSGEYQVTSGNSYLDNPTDPNYLKPTNNNKDGNKNGWDGVVLNGAAENLSAIIPSNYYTDTKKGGSWGWIVENKSTKPRLYEQVIENGVYEIGNNVNFKSLAKIWWDTFGDLFDVSGSNAYKWKTTSPASDVTVVESTTEKLRNEIRFAKTMREIMFKAGLISSIDDLDYYLLEIASKKDESNKLLPRREDITKSAYRAGNINDLVVAIATKKIFTEDFVKLGDLSLLVEDIEKEKRNISFLEFSDLATADDLVKKNVEELSLLQSQINEYENELLVLHGLLDFDQLPPEDKLKKIKDEYENKKDGKWKLSQIRSIVKWIDIIKPQITDDEYNRELKEKRTKLKEVWDKAKLATPGYDIISQYKEYGSDDKERIKGIKQGKDATERKTAFEEYKKAFQEVAGHVNLEDNEQISLTAISTEITSPSQDDDDAPPVVELKPEELKTLLNASEKPSDAILSKWKTELGRTGTELNNKEKIGELINKTGYDKKDSTNDAEKKRYIEKWHPHLKGHAYGDAKVEKDDMEEQWNEFIKKDPKIVIGAILFFEYEESGDDNIKKTKAAMKKVKEDKLKEDKVESVDDSWNEEDQKDMTKYLFRKYTGRTLLENVKTKTDEVPIPKKEDETKEPSWFKFRSDNVWRPLVTYGGGLILILAVAGAVFWKNITEWWNGPAEEEGEIGEDGEKSEDDN